jgi:MFS family permease
MDSEARADEAVAVGLGKEPTTTRPELRRAALLFVVLIGVVSLFADTTYEGARSIVGPYMLVLGASATVVGIVAGLGELVGYGLRIVSGRISDRTRQYWTITLLGYAINMLAVPLLAIAGSWQIAALLIIAERAGKATRNPARDAMLSHASSQIGRGWAFGLHEALDQTGAMAGPLILALVLYLHGSYELAFAILLAPAILALSFLLAARFRYPNPADFELEEPRLDGSLPRTFWLYLLGVGLMAAAYTDFPLIAFHFKDTNLAADGWTPVFYAVAMAVAGAASLLLGRLFDRFGIPTLVGALLIAACFPVLVFYGGLAVALVGMVCWGVGLGAQESIMKASVVHLVPPTRRASAFGTFDFGFGVAWFAGSALMGFLYDQSLAALVIFSVALQLAAAVWIFAIRTRLSPVRV